MDLERMFDLVVHIAENSGEDYVLDKAKNIVLTPKLQRRVIAKSIQAFMQDVGTPIDREKKVAIQAFTGSSELPQLTSDVFNVTQAAPNFDTYWQAAFKGVPLRKGQLTWEIADVAAGLSFEMVPEGGKAKIYSISGSSATVGINKYGAGVGITWEMIEGRKLYQFVDLMLTVRAQLNVLWANTHYALIAAAGAASVVDYPGLVTDPVLDRDIGALNNAYLEVGTVCKDKGYGDTANMPMICIAQPALKGRIMHAINATQVEVSTGRAVGATGVPSGGQVLNYPIIPYFTFNANIVAAKAYMILPGNKIQNSVYLRELGLQEQDISTLSQIRTYWTAFGAAIGDADQIARVDMAD